MLRSPITPPISTATQAAAELSTMPTYAGPRDSSGNVTPDLLFRCLSGDTSGPTFPSLIFTHILGVQPLSQQLVSFVPHVDR